MGYIGGSMGIDLVQSIPDGLVTFSCRIGMTGKMHDSCWGVFVMGFSENYIDKSSWPVNLNRHELSVRKIWFSCRAVPVGCFLTASPIKKLYPDGF